MFLKWIFSLKRTNLFCLNLQVCSQMSAVLLFLQVSLKENGSLSKDSNVTMEIPTHTTIAYALIELEIKHDGCFGERS